MKITVVSMEDRVNDPLYKVITDNHRRYSEKNEYTYFEVNNYAKYPNLPHPVWYKFWAIDEALNTDADYVLWVDGMDVIFTNFNKRIEDFIVDDSEIFLSKDDKGGRCLFDYGWNIGVILLKNTERVKKFVKLMKEEWLCKMFHSMTLTRIVNFLEQSAMEWAFENLEEWKGLVKEIPSKSFNSYIQQRAYVGNAWTPRRFHSSFGWYDKSAENKHHAVSL